MRAPLLYAFRTGFCSVFLLPGLLPVAQAQGSNALQTALNRCYAITSVSARVDCYDALVREQQTVSAPVPGAPSAAQIIAAPSTPRDASAAAPPVAVKPAVDSPVIIAAPPQVAEFGQHASVETNEEGESELTDTVAAVKRVEPTKLQITLTSGQVWRQSVGKSFMVRQGETVHISASRWGDDYRLRVEGRAAYIQVSRQQ